MKTVKKYFLLLPLIISFHSFAEEKETMLINDDICVQSATISSRFMELRQNGNSAVKSIELAKQLSQNNPELYKLFKYLIISSYSENIENEKIDKEKKVREFSNKIVIECLKEISDREDVSVFKTDNFPEEWREFFLNQLNNKEAQ